MGAPNVILGVGCEGSIYSDRRLSSSCHGGWAGYLAVASQLNLFDKLDQWIRRAFACVPGNAGVNRARVAVS